MGSPKALLLLNGVTFLSRIVKALATGGCEPVLVVTGPEKDPDARMIAEEARSLGASVVTNPDRASPQSESVRVALDHLGSALHAAVITPVDAPEVRPELVMRLIEAGQKGAPIALPTFEGRRGHPVLFAGSALAALRSEELPEGARTLLRRYQQEVVEVPAGPEVLLDIDTPADYGALVEGRE